MKNKYKSIRVSRDLLECLNETAEIYRVEGGTTEIIRKALRRYHRLKPSEDVFINPGDNAGTKEQTVIRLKHNGLATELKGKLIESIVWWYLNDIEIELYEVTTQEPFHTNLIEGVDYIIKEQM